MSDSVPTTRHPGRQIPVRQITGVTGPRVITAGEIFFDPNQCDMQSSNVQDAICELKALIPEIDFSYTYPSWTLRLDREHGKELADGANGMETPFKRPDELFSFMAQQINQRLTDGEPFESMRYVVPCAPGAYPESFVIPNLKYLRVEMPGVIFTGNPVWVSTEVPASPYSSIEFVGSQSTRPDKGIEGAIYGDIGLARDNSSLVYVSFTGLHLKGGISCNNGTHLMNFRNSVFDAAPNKLSTTNGAKVLLETHDHTQFLSELYGDVSLYNVTDSYFTTLNTTPTEAQHVTGTRFNGSFTINGGTFGADATSLRSLFDISNTTVLTAVTLSLLDNTGYIGHTDGSAWEGGGSGWAGTPPASAKEALDRIASALSDHLGFQIP
jgi:hypothetical protein